MTTRSTSRLLTPIVSYLLLITLLVPASLGFLLKSKTPKGILPSSSRWHALFLSTRQPDLGESLLSVEDNPVDLSFVDFCGTLEAAPPVVFLHGLLGQKRNFGTIGQSLARQLQTPRRILSADLRNHGDNTHDWRECMDYPSMAADVISLLDAQEIQKAVLVGHSVGGKVAQATALLYPDRVEGLVVLDIAPVQYVSETDAHWKAVEEIISALTAVELTPSMSKRQVDELLQPVIADPALRAFCLTNLDVKTGTWKVHLEAICKQLDTLADFQLPHHSTYQGDVFLIHGGQSRFVRHAYMPAIASYFPNHLLTTIRSAGHWVHAEAPEDTTALLKKYLDR